jgi:exonuclease III
LCLNCCGLNLRLNYTEFGKLICQRDLICLQETKTDDTDQINFPGYIFRTKNRQKASHRKSGGIYFGYKEELEKLITTIKKITINLYFG